jgi:hypothetical protein
MTTHEVLNQSSITYFEQMEKEHQSVIFHNVRNGFGNELAEILSIMNPFWLLYSHDNTTFETSYKPYFFHPQVTLHVDFLCLYEIIGEFFPKETTVQKDISIIQPTAHFGNLSTDALKAITFLFEENVDMWQHTSKHCIIKIKIYLSTPLLEMLYKLSFLYETVHLVKPSVSDCLSPFAFVVCQERKNDLKEDFLQVLPLSFVNEVEEFTVLLFKNILNKYNQINHLLKYRKNNSRQDENPRILCQEWCEKYNLVEKMKDKRWERNTGTFSL